MRVLKFGGTSVGTIESLKNVKAIIEATPRPAIVVVSALGGLTDKLIATARKAAEGEEAVYKQSMAEIRERHHSVINGVVESDKIEIVTAAVDKMLDELERLYLGVYLVADLSERVLDRIVSFGERMSSMIVSGMIPEIELKDARQFIKTVKRHGKNKLDVETTDRLIADCLPAANLPEAITLTQGFISTDDKGDVTNLGRGGSDYTAAILAAAFNADVLEIWTDVDGFLTADPRKIKGTRIIDKMSFVEAMELCNYGAKVIYPPTIYPVFHKSIPIKIKNTFNPEAPGTLITEGGEGSARNISGISSLPETALLEVRFSDDCDSNTCKRRILNSLARKGVDLFTSNTESAGSSMSLIVRSSEAETAIEELEMEFAVEIDDAKVRIAPIKASVATIAVVGENIDSRAKLLEDIESMLVANHIHPLSANTSNAGNNITIVVEHEQELSAMQRVHDYLFT